MRRKSRRAPRFLDCYWDAERVVVEIDGAGHADIEVMRDDHERQNDVVLQGDRIFPRVFTWVLEVRTGGLHVAAGADRRKVE